MQIINKTRVFAIAKKEFFHIIHDTRSLIIVFLLPLIQLIMFGYALNTEIKNINLGISDNAKTEQSRALIKSFMGSDLYHVYSISNNSDDIHHAFLQKKVNAVLLISHDMRNLQLIIDGSDPNSASIIKNYISQTLSSGQSIIPIDIRTQLLFNPELKSSYFFVPGLIALILVMISALLTSISITREKENGTLEQLLISPLLPLEFILGKLLPYIFISMTIGFLILICGLLLFDVVFLGSAIAFTILSFVYVCTALSFGLMISTVSQTQMQAMLIALIFTMMPTLMLSGFMLPLESMPWLIRIISWIVPAKYFLKIARGLMIKGNNLTELLEPMLFLLGFTILLLSIAWNKFAKQMKELK
ncbi:MAG TPA: ABC transporter permease [Candidatus Cloacimonadota bacterium]|nr:ABC transporter permease [Candidatus Cloacimonadota bacterium]